MSILHIFLGTFAIFILIGYLFIKIYPKGKEGFETNSGYQGESQFKQQSETLSKKYDPMSDGKRPIGELLSDGKIPEFEECFVNFYALATRFTGYIGPFDEGYFDPEKAVELAVKAGCRTFILEIDYLDECKGETIQYFPRLVVRDVQGKMRIKFSSNRPMCNSPAHSNIRKVCELIEHFAFSIAQNKSDPVVIVLYFLRVPPGSYKSKTVLDYYSNVAKALSPFQNRLITNELEGGSFYRQKQEGKLLIGNIQNYNGKVLIFSNANTSGFRDMNTYSPFEDLDYLVNLRLTYTQTKMGATDDQSNGSFGLLETAEDYLIIPKDRQEDIVENNKLKWTVCLSRDSSQPVSDTTYKKITGTYGINCVPIQIFDDKNGFMFTDKTFKTYSFIPKPVALRYIKPPIVVPGEPNPNTDAKHGLLRSPQI